MPKDVKRNFFKRKFLLLNNQIKEFNLKRLLLKSNEKKDNNNFQNKVNLIKIHSNNNQCTQQKNSDITSVMQHVGTPSTTSSITLVQQLHFPTRLHSTNQQSAQAHNNTNLQLIDQFTTNELTLIDPKQQQHQQNSSPSKIINNNKNNKKQQEEQESENNAPEKSSTSPALKLPAMSRLLAVDSDNYMIHKSTASATEQQQAQKNQQLTNGSSTINLEPSTDIEFLQLASKNPRENGTNEFDADDDDDVDVIDSPHHPWSSTNNNSNGYSILEKQDKIVSCARLVNNFHHLFCWCQYESQQNHLNGDLMKNGDNNNLEKSYEDLKIYSTSNGDCELNHHNGINNGIGIDEVDNGKVDDDSSNNDSDDSRLLKSSNSNNIIGAQCCCMCTIVCPLECFACFHNVCSEYSHQQTCQWTKTNAQRNQTYDTEKVSS